MHLIRLIKIFQKNINLRLFNIIRNYEKISVMNSELDELKLNFRKLRISDYNQFKKLFKNSFNKKISYDFFKWRYFKDKHSFCYGAFKSSRLIANVGMFSIKLNDNKCEKNFF